MLLVSGLFGFGGGEPLKPTKLAESILGEAIAKGLIEGGEKRRLAAAELVANLDRLRVKDLIECLRSQFIESPFAEFRRAGITGIGAIGFGFLESSGSSGLSAQDSVTLTDLSRLLLVATNDDEPKVRFVAAESLFNFLKGMHRLRRVPELLQSAVEPFQSIFSSVFEATCKLSADVDGEVIQAAELLNGVLQDLVCAFLIFVKPDQLGLIQAVSYSVEERIRQPDMRIRLVGFRWCCFLANLNQKDLFPVSMKLIDCIEREAGGPEASPDLSREAGACIAFMRRCIESQP